MTTLNTLNGNGGGAAVGGWSRAFLSTGSITFTQDGDVVLSYAAAGGGGAAGNSTSGSGTGGNSGPWGRKKFRVAAGDVLVVNIAAGGLKAAANANNGSAGSTATVTLNGVTIMTIQGGEGGIYAAGTATATAPTPTATITGADFVVPGIQAGSAAASSNANASGGAALDVLQTGLGRSPNISGAGATNNAIGGSIGNNTGGIPQSWLLLAEWGIAITDPSAASTQNGAPGRGGISSSSIKPGIFAGSAASGGGPTQQAGGGAGGTIAGAAHNGGDAYAYMTFTPLS